MFSLLTGAMSSAIISMLANIFSILFSVMIMLTIGFDLKVHGKKDRALWMVLSFFFPVIVGIVYLIKRNSYKNNAPKICLNCNTPASPDAVFCTNCGGTNLQSAKNPETDKNEKSRNTTFIIGIVSLVLSVTLSITALAFTISSFGGLDELLNNVIGYIDDDNYDFDFDSDYDFDLDNYFDEDYYGYKDTEINHYAYTSNGNAVYYDMKGNAYFNSSEVLYYDKNDVAYRYDKADGEFESTVNDDVEINAYYCYIDKDGYLYYDSDDLLEWQDEYDENADEYSGYYCDVLGNKYYDVMDVSWNSEGKLVDSYDGTLIRF